MNSWELEFEKNMDKIILKFVYFNKISYIKVLFFE